MKYPTIRIEGSILSSDILDKIQQGELLGQKPKDFWQRSSSKVKDEIVKAWADAYRNMGLACYYKGWKTSAADNFYQAGITYLKQYNRQMVLQTIDVMKDMVPESPLIQKLENKLYE